MGRPDHRRNPVEPFPHLAALDGLRGVAVSLVVAYHLFPHQVPGGFLGVDVFFVLSGFLITSLLVQEVAGRGHVALGRFYIRRTRRLLPALCLVLLVLSAGAAFLGIPEDVARLRSHALWTLGYSANWKLIADGTTYTDLIAGQSPLRHTWSLAIEEQFYVLFPLLVIVLARVVGGEGRRLRRALVVLGSGLAIASAAWAAVIADPGNPSRGYFGTDTRAQSLLVGVVLGAVLVGRPPTSGRPALVARAAALAGLAVMVAGVASSHETSMGLQRGGFLVVAVATAGVIAGLQALRPLRRALSIWPLVQLGVISYGVYLWHWPVIVLLDAERTGLDGIPLTVLRIAVTLTLSIASFVLVERPIRQGALGRALGPVAVGMAPVAIALVATVVVASTVVPSGPVRAGRVFVPSAAAASPTTVASDPLDLVVEGDSVAHTLAGGTVGAFPDFQPWSVEQSPFDPSVVHVTSVAKPACTFLPGIILGPDRTPLDLGRYCEHWQDELAAALVGTSSAVVLVAPANEAADRMVDGHFVAADSPAEVAMVADWLDEVRSIARAHGGEVVLLALPSRTGRAAAAAGPGGGHDEALRAALRAYVADRPGVRLLDLAAEICPNGDCSAPKDGFDPRWRYDGIHFTRDGAGWVAEWLTRQLVSGAP